MALKFTLNTQPLIRLAELTDQHLEATAEKLAQETVERAQQIVPVRTGALRDSIEKEQEGEMRWAVVAGMPYAAAVEFGTARGRPARPYLTPAMEEARQKLPDVVAEALRAAAKEAGA